MANESLPNNENTKKEKTIIIGRRKEAVAHLIAVPGEGKVTINDKESSDFFFMDKSLTVLIKKPFLLLNKEKDYDLQIKVKSGGFSAQAQAIVLAGARFLVKNFPDSRLLFKSHGLLTRDNRHKERRKPGLLKARKRPPFVKR